MPEVREKGWEDPIRHIYSSEMKWKQLVVEGQGCV